MFYSLNMPPVSGAFKVLLAVMIIWDTVWKLIAMWRAARNQQKGWFVCLAIFNTIGILPIIYLLTHRKPQEA